MALQSKYLIARKILIITTLLSSTIFNNNNISSKGVVVVKAESAIYSHCDSNSIKDNKKASDLNPNTFYKICPGIRSSTKPFGQPKCGDGTSFSFFFTRPIQKYNNENKLLIEFMGGGACWDSNTCAMQEEQLTYPEKLDNFIGYSCSEVDYWAENGGGDMDGNDRNLEDVDISMLCAKQIGNVDFTTYNSIIVPYCTQDIHIGSNITYYDDDDDDDSSSSSNGIYHMGAHNVMSTLRWVFKNFHNPSHIVLTGCSAGGAGRYLI